MPGKAEIIMCQYTGEEHEVVVSNTPQGRVLALDLKQSGIGYCPSHDTYSVTRVTQQPEANTAS